MMLPEFSHVFMSIRDLRMRKIIKLAENDLEVTTEGGTFVSVMGDTFEIVMGGTFKTLPSKVRFTE